MYRRAARNNLQEPNKIIQEIAEAQENTSNVWETEMKPVEVRAKNKRMEQEILGKQKERQEGNN